MQAHIIPLDFDYISCKALSTEARQKLAQRRPETLAQAAQIDGVRATDLASLLVLTKR